MGGKVGKPWPNSDDEAEEAYIFAKMVVGDAKIEACLRETVRKALKDGEQVMVSEARRRTEKKLGLGNDYLKNTHEWKERSKNIIKAAFEEEEEEEEQTEAPAKKVTEDAPKPQKRSKKDKAAAETVKDTTAKATPQPPKAPETTAPKVNGVKRKAPESESTTAAGSKNANKEPEQPSKKKAKVASPAPRKPHSDQESSSRSEESSDSGSGSEEESSGSDEKNAAPAPPPAKPKKSSQEKPAETPQDNPTPSIPAKTFTPPSGYTPLPSSLASAFTPSDLSGRQIWHITAPSTLPLSTLTSFALDSIKSGEPVLTHKNVPYILAEDSSTTPESTAMLIPTKEGGYRKLDIGGAGVTRTLHLRQQLLLPDLSSLTGGGSAAAADLARAAVSTVRPQPEGLRMRYLPPGVRRSNSEGAMGVEDGQGEKKGGGANFQFPKTMGQFGVEVRQDGDVEMGDAGEVGGVSAEGRREKREKRKRKEKGKGDGEGGEAARVNGVHEAGKAVEPVANGPVEKASEPTVNGSADKEKESKEERKRRKEEKRARKEAKAKAA